MKMIGTRCHISSIRLARPGFYVAIPQRKFSISCDYDNLSDAVQVIEPLLCAKILSMFVRHHRIAVHYFSRN